MGQGLTLSEKLHIGGYFSTDYQASNEVKKIRVDDVALLAYGTLYPELTYLAELEAAPFYEHNYTDKTDKNNARFYYERLYLDYKYSQLLNFRVGKQISPIGYWNLEPINVLRDTSSSPLYSLEMFPKFLSGLDIYGYLDESASLEYHIFGQKNNHLDEKTLNIDVEQFFALSLEHEINSEFTYGGSLGNFITKDKKYINYFQLDAHYDFEPFSLQMEAAYDSINDTVLEQKNYKVGGYTQGIYHLNEKHALIGRYEYFHDSSASRTNNIGVLGYSYRPIFPISLKGELQYNSDERYNQFLISLSVLF